MQSHVNKPPNAEKMKGLQGTHVRRLQASRWYSARIRMRENRRAGSMLLNAEGKQGKAMQGRKKSGSTCGAKR